MGKKSGNEWKQDNDSMKQSMCDHKGKSVCACVCGSDEEASIKSFCASIALVLELKIYV